MVSPFLGANVDHRQGYFEIFYGLCRCGQDHQPPNADICRGETYIASRRLAGILN